MVGATGERVNEPELHVLDGRIAFATGAPLDEAIARMRPATAVAREARGAAFRAVSRRRRSPAYDRSPRSEKDLPLDTRFTRRVYWPTTTSLICITGLRSVYFGMSPMISFAWGPNPFWKASTESA